MRKILFVDDESLVLQGIKRMLRPLRKEWDMEFAGSGEAALEILGKADYDVIVSDMRMPAMDGAQLLAEVQKRHPQVVRIILSGHSDKELILRSVGPAHQFLAKPCDADMVKDTITRACALRDLLNSESLKKLVSGIESLPSLPGFYTEVLEEISSPDSSLQKVGDIISKDIGMTAKTLQLVNSAFFGLPKQVSSASQAVNLLGLDTIKALVLSVHVFSQFERTDIRKSYIDFLFRHSTTVGACARLICVEEKAEPKLRDDALMAGMLHEIGALILAANMPEEYARVLKHAREDHLVTCAAEQELLGATHTEVGAYLLGLWGFPNPIVEAVAFQHAPDKCSCQHFAPLTAVHVANVFDYEGRKDAESSAPQIDTDYLNQLKLLDRVPAWRERCNAAAAEETSHE